MKKLFSLLLTAAMVCSLAVTAGAADVVPISASANGTAAPVAAPAPDLTGSTVILHTNDVHGAIAGYAKVAALKQYYRTAAPMFCCWTPETIFRAIPPSAPRRAPQPLS